MTLCEVIAIIILVQITPQIQVLSQTVIVLLEWYKRLLKMSFLTLCLYLSMLISKKYLNNKRKKNQSSFIHFKKKKFYVNKFFSWILPFDIFWNNSVKIQLETYFFSLFWYHSALNGSKSQHCTFIVYL